MTPNNDRVPILLGGAVESAWLYESITAAELRPAGENASREWPITKRLNRTRTGDDDLVVTE